LSRKKNNPDLRCVSRSSIREWIGNRKIGTGKPHDLNGIIDGFQIFPEKPIHTVQLVQDFNQKWGYPWNFMGKKWGFKGNFSLDI